jgi:hypothetical protein
LESGYTGSPSNLNLNGGTLKANARNIFLYGNFTVTAGVFEADTSYVEFDAYAGNQTLTSNGATFHTVDIETLGGYSLSLVGPLTVSGDWSSGSLTPLIGTSTVTFTSGVHALDGSTTFYALRSPSAGTTLQFQEGTTNYVTNMVEFRNTSLLSTTNNATWYFSYTGSSQTLVGLYVQDSNASPNGGTVMAADVTSTDGGNNTNWSFPGITPQTLTWTGASSTAWALAGNWSPAQTPTPIDTVIIASTTNKPQLSAGVSVASMTIQNGGALNLNNFNITVSSDLILVGTMTASGT